MLELIGLADHRNVLLNLRTILGVSWDDGVLSVIHALLDSKVL